MTFDVETMREDIRRRNGMHALFVDCLSGFGCTLGKNLIMHAETGLFWLLVGKPMTTLYGGALLTNRRELATAVRTFRDRTYRQPGRIAVFRRWLYFIASWAVLSTAMVL